MIKTNTLVGLATAAVLAAAPALAADVKVGILGDITGPIESLAPPIVAGAQLAFDEVNAQGGILGGGKIVVVTGDSACDPSVAGPAADKLVNTDKVTAIVGAFCTGATIGAATAAGIPGGVVQISPSASAPALTTLDDKDLVFRTTPSDAFQGVKLADLLIQKGIKDVALTYVNNDYGKGLADVFKAQYAKDGGTVSADVAHEDGKADYRPEIGQIEAAGATALVIYGYENSGGGAILNQAIESGSFDLFMGGDGMAGDALLASRNGADLEGMILTQAAAAEGPAYNALDALTAAAGQDVNGTYVTNSYDAVFLLALAIEKNGSADRAGVSAALREIANGPGETILPGEWAKAKELIAAGTDINYEGASGSIEFDDAGDVAGAINYWVIEGGVAVDKGLIK